MIEKDKMGLLGWVRYKFHKLKYNEFFGSLFFTVFSKYYRTEHMRFSYPRDMVGFMQRSRFFYDIYESEERELANKYLRSNDRVLELGSCIGIVSCVINKNLTSSESHHVAVEPNPNLVPVIEENRKLNNRNFAIENCAIADDEEVEFQIDDHITRGGLRDYSEVDNGAVVRVPGRSIDDLVKKYGAFNVLVMDIQGAEEFVFSGACDFLDPIRLIIVEWHPKIIGGAAVTRCRDILLRHGFRMAEALSDVEAWLRTSEASITEVDQ